MQTIQIHRSQNSQMIFSAFILRTCSPVELLRRSLQFIHDTDILLWFCIWCMVYTNALFVPSSLFRAIVYIVLEYSHLRISIQCGVVCFSLFYICRHLMNRFSHSNTTHRIENPILEFKTPTIYRLTVTTFSDYCRITRTSSALKVIE